MLLSVFSILAAFASGNAQATDAASGVSATIVSVAGDHASIEITETGKAQSAKFNLSDGIKNKIAKNELVLKDGYQINLKADDKNTATSIQIERSATIPGQERWGAIALSALALFVFSMIVLWLAGQKGLFSFRAFIVGEDNRYSNSKFQIALWFFVAITTYVAVVWQRWCIAGGEYLLVDIPHNLLLLSGMSVLTFGGAKAITASRSKPEETLAAAQAVQKVSELSNNADSAAKAANEADALAKRTNLDEHKQLAFEAAVHLDAARNELDAAKTDAAQKAEIDGYNTGTPKFFRDLLQNDHGKVDFGDFQLLVVTGLAVCVYLLQVDTFMQHVDFVKTVTLPDVDTTILSVFGLGQGAYLVKKYAGATGES